MATTHRAYSEAEGWHDTDEDFPPFRTMEDVREANRAIGHHWFDADTLRFFRSRIGGALYGGRYFVSSEQFQGSWSEGHYSEPRRYTVRVANQDGTVDTVGEFQAYASRAQALRAIRELLA